MSNIWLLVALAGTFCAVAAAGFALEAARAGRRRITTLLETQVEPVPLANIREHELARPFGDRAMKPVLSGLARAGRRITPLDVRDRIARKLVLAGSPEAWDADRIAALKVAGILVGSVGGFLLGRVVGTTGAAYVILVVITTGGGYLLPDMFLSRAVDTRQTGIQRALPDTMDLLTISVEAGLGFDAALGQVVQHVPGPLSEEISRMLQEIQLGKPRVDSFRNLAERTSVEDLNGFVLAIIQADIFGVSISNVLRSQAKEIRLRRKQRAERAAMQVPVKILFPMIFCVLPSLFVVILGPGAIRIVQNFHGLGV